jgi:hypothetical protein
MAVYDDGERNRLLLLHQKATDSFDRAIMTLSAGALAISITFVHDVAPHPRHTSVLGFSWLCFALSLLLILWSFLTSERVVVRMVNQLDAEVDNIPPGKLTDWANWASAATFILGVILLVIFAWLNL